MPPRHQLDQQPEPKQIAEQFPNVGQFTEGKKADVHENNFFKDMDIEEVHRRYVRFSVFMESVNEALSLDNHSTIETFAFRVRDLVYANQRES